MKTPQLLSLVTIATIPSAYADIEPGTIHPLEAQSVSLRIVEARPEEGQKIEVRATAVFSNGCMVPDETLRGMKEEKNALAYTFYARPGRERICTTEYDPVEKTFLIDRISVPAGQSLPNVTVNGTSARLEERADI